VFVLLSPAKKLTRPALSPEIAPSLPHFADRAAELVEVARRLSVADLRSLMHLSEPLARLTVDRFAAWRDDHAEAAPAALTFAGDTYVGLDAASLTDDDLAWAQRHIGILSGLYGVLSPLDRIHPYRLEMGSRLQTARGADLYAFWGDQVAERVAELAARGPDRTVVNLASEEYASVIPGPRRPQPWITPVFQDVKDGEPRTLGFFAKRARGAMARWIIRERVERAEAIVRCDVLGYRYEPAASTADRWVFRREQPPPVAR
jgi:uncharacterized protein